MATATFKPILLGRALILCFHLCNEPNVCIRTCTRAVALCLHESETLDSLPQFSAKSAAPLLAYTRPRAHYDSLLGPFVGSPVLRFHFALFFILATAASAAVATTDDFGFSFQISVTPFALHPLRLVGAADTCRASASTTNEKRKKKKRKREKRIKELKKLNKEFLLKRV